MEWSSRPGRPDAVEHLARRLEKSANVVVLTGAGCSTESGIPDYRGDDGQWKRPRPMLFDEFRRSERNRRRYWARNFVGWPRLRDARPNDAHVHLAGLEREGFVAELVTQNVDGLHSEAGHRRVMELHGNASRVRCLDCRGRFGRSEVQKWLGDANPDWQPGRAPSAPDADAVVDEDRVDEFRLVGCPDCAGSLKPDVVFFGESVSRALVDRAFAAVGRADLLLVAGSSLKVWSGFRFVRSAVERGVPVAIINRGRTRADDLATLRLSGTCSAVLRELTRTLGLEVSEPFASSTCGPSSPRPF